MPATRKIATVIGGSGFVGRYITHRLARDGWSVRVACRRPNEALFVRSYGVVGQVEPVLANIRDEASTRAVIEGADVVVNCVGILREGGRQSFQAVHVEGAERVARLAARAGARTLVHVSALGADPVSDSAYARTKALGEQAVQAAFPAAVILRPSAIFGPEDEFFNKFGAIARLAPVVPVVGGNTRFQPVFVEDVALAAMKAVDGLAEAGIYELGGPETATLRELVQLMLQITRRRRLVVNLPFWMARIMAWFPDMAAAATLHLIENRVLTRDQVRMLAHDSVVSEGARGFAELGIQPEAMEAILPTYLYVYREKGQYQDIVESARKLRMQD